MGDDEVDMGASEAEGRLTYEVEARVLFVRVLVNAPGSGEATAWPPFGDVAG